MTARAISFWHTLTLFSWRDILAGKRDDEKRVGSRMECFCFFLNEQMPGIAKDIRRYTHPQYIVSAPSVTCYIPCLEHFVRKETSHQWRNFLPAVFTSFSLLPPPSHLVFSPLPTLAVFTFHFSSPGPILSHSLSFKEKKSCQLFPLWSSSFIPMSDIGWCWMSP